MKKYLLPLVIIFCFNCKASSKSDYSTADYQNTYAIIIGALKWSDPNLSSFPAANRKDEELYKLLKTLGINTDNILFLKDQEATLKNITKSLDQILKKTEKGSRFIFYYAGHGMHVNKTGKYYFANYDINTSAPETTGLDLAIIEKSIKDNFKGSEIALWADCCYSGALEFTAKNLSDAGYKVWSLTSATAHNTSTGNWTYSQMLIYCLRGDPINDLNRDGKITIAELVLDVRAAMQYRERQLNGYSSYNMDVENITFSYVTGKTNTQIIEIGSYVFALNNHQWEMARITDKIGDNYFCEFYHYADKITSQLTDKEIRKPYFVHYNNGIDIKIEYEGQWYDGRIEKSNGDFYFITYKGYDHSWDEWVLYDRIRTGTEKQHKVLWNDQYYDAEILDSKDNQHYVHYVGDSYIWDEWVDKTRLK